jgi:hypothetical protein
MGLEFLKKNVIPFLKDSHEGPRGVGEEREPELGLDSH